MKTYEEMNSPSWNLWEKVCFSINLGKTQFSIEISLKSKSLWISVIPMVWSLGNPWMKRACMRGYHSWCWETCGTVHQNGPVYHTWELGQLAKRRLTSSSHLVIYDVCVTLEMPIPGCLWLLSLTKSSWSGPVFVHQRPGPEVFTLVMSCETL